MLIEQQAKPGGSCTSFRRNGVTFDVGTAMIYGFGERGFKPFRWVNRFAGEAGWMRPERRHEGWSAAVFGGNLAGMTCAYILALAGFSVAVFDQAQQPIEDLPEAQNDLEPVLKMGIHYHGGQEAEKDTWQSYSTIYIASEAWVKPFDQAAGLARVFKASSDVAYLLPAQAVAEGRRAAFEMAAFRTKV